MRGGDLPGLIRSRVNVRLDRISPGRSIGLSVNTSTPLVEAMKRAGASAFVSKDAVAADLHKTISALISTQAVQEG